MRRMTMTWGGGLGLLLCTGGLLACDSNPTVNPEAQLKAKGRALKADGTPLGNARIDLIRFFDSNRVAAFKIEPSVDDLFECGTSEDCDVPELALQVEHVMSGQTDSSGAFELNFKGEDIAVRGGITDAMGNVEGSNLVLVIKDPSDAAGRAGVFTKGHTFSGADFSWDAGDLKLWSADANVQLESASGLARFSWNRLSPEPSGGRNFYRLEVAGETSARLVVRCEVGAAGASLGGCLTGDAGKLAYQISTFSLYSYYSNNGSFSAYVTGEGVMYRFRAKFAPPPSLPRPSGEKAGIAGIWAVGSGSDQALKNTRADDEMITTRESITNNATAIYVKFDQGASLSDAGILGSVVSNAYEACVTIETNTSDFATVTAAKANTTGWTAKGKFCGGNGGDTALSALVNFNPKQLTPWLRFVISPSDTSHVFKEIGEVAAFSATN